MEDLYVRKAKITNVVDGDTVDAEIDFGFGIKQVHRLRLLGVDTPERNEEGWSEATNYTRHMLLGLDVTIQSHKSDSFGRYLADIFLPSGRKYNDILLETGFAKVFER